MRYTRSICRCPGVTGNHVSTTRGISGVTITILNHSEYGQTLSRADGMFDLAVNGGGHVTVEYEKEDYLPAQRQVKVPWQDYVWLPDVIMIPVDPQVTTVDLTSSEPFQVAQGSVVTDDDGTRQAVLMIPQGTTAAVVTNLFVIFILNAFVSGLFYI